MNKKCIVCGSPGKEHVSIIPSDTFRKDEGSPFSNNWPLHDVVIYCDKCCVNVEKIKGILENVPECHGRFYLRLLLDVAKLMANERRKMTLNEWIETHEEAIALIRDEYVDDGCPNTLFVKNDPMLRHWAEDCGVNFEEVKNG